MKKFKIFISATLLGYPFCRVRYSDGGLGRLDTLSGSLRKVFYNPGSDLIIDYDYAERFFE